MRIFLNPTHKVLQLKTNKKRSLNLKQNCFYGLVNFSAHIISRQINTNSGWELHNSNAAKVHLNEALSN